MNRLLLVVWLLLPTQAVAQELGATSNEAADATKLRCAQAYEMSQRLRQDGKLLAAHEQALTCAQAACPHVLSGDCTTWLAELDGALASVVIDVRDARGEPVQAARVSVDGQLLARSLDGRALRIDPGQRNFRVVLPGGQQLERSVVVSEGKKGQYLRFDLAPPPASAPREQSRRLTPWAYGAAVASLMGGVGFAYFGLHGRAEEQRLDASCSPRCSSSDVGALRRTYLAADISLGLGVAALGALGYLWFTSGDEARPAVGASASNGGALLALRQRF